MSSSVKAFLCSQDGTVNYPIVQKITTIGRENCDIVINASGVDNQHALIEYVDDENCYILQDLNSSGGTYINECRIQNAAVRLVEQDSISFGYNGTPFQFIVQSHFTTIPPINLNAATRSSANGLQIITQTIPSRNRLVSSTGQQSSSGVWVANPLPNSSLITINNQTQSCCGTETTTATGSQVLKPPQTLRTRPISAGPPRRISRDSKTSWIKNYTTQDTNSYHSINVEAHPIDNDTYRLKQDENDYNIRVNKLEREIKSKTIEIKDLREKLAFFQNQQSASVEYEQIKRDKSVAVGLVNQMQKDLSNKDITISKLAREIDALKRDAKENEKARKELEDKLRIVSDSKKLEEENALKEKELVVLRSKFKATESKVIDLTNQVLSIKNELEESIKQSHKQSQVEKKLKEELDHAKTRFQDMQSAECTVRVDLEKLKRSYDNFRNLIIQSIYSTPGVKQPISGDISNEELVAKWKEITNERTRLYETIESLKKNLSAHENSSAQLMASITQFENRIETIEESLTSGGRRAAIVDAQLASLESLETNESLAKLQQLIVDLYKNESKSLAAIEKTLLDSFSIDINNSESLEQLLLVVKSQLDAQVDIKIGYEARIKELEESQSVLVKQEMDKQVAEYEARLVQLQVELNEKHKKELDDTEAKHNSFIEIIKSDYETQINNLIQVKETLSSQIHEVNSGLESVKLEYEAMVADFNVNIEALRVEKVNLEQELNVKIEAHTALIAEYDVKIQEQTTSCDELKLKLMSAEEEYNKELEMYKEQIKQHSLTIVNFEKELSRLRERELEYKCEIESLRKSKIIERSVIVPAVQSIKTQDCTLEIASLNKTIDLLRGECQTYKIRMSEQEELIKTLRRDLSGASAKLTDIQGEMTEKQKRELERNKSLVIEQQRELSEHRAQMAKLSEIVEKQTKQLESLKIELNKAKAMMDKYRVTSEESAALAIELKTKLEDVEGQLKKVDQVKKEEGKLTCELTAIGAQCKGERHEQVIVRQREALNELRQKVKQLEQNRPLVPNQQQQMQQQIMLLKKQLAEVRASQALSEDIAKQANITRGNDHSSLILEEKTAHYETQSALEASEETYLTLIKTIAAVLEMAEIDGLRSINNLATDERQRLIMERTKSIESICLKIKSLQEKLRRKDELLREYEMDLARLRQAEFLLNKKSDQLDEIQLFSRTKEEEIEYLKESLKSVKSDLEKERLLNAALKQKKPLHTVTTITEKVRRDSTDTLHHHCPPEDQQASQIKKTMSEKIKRKDYELKVLKEEIKNKAEEISNLTSRLTIVQNGQLKN